MTERLQSSKPAFLSHSGFTSSCTTKYFRSNFTCSRRRKDFQGEGAEQSHSAHPGTVSRRIAPTSMSGNWDDDDDDDAYAFLGEELTPEEKELANSFEEGLPLLNRIVLTGRLGADPELRVISSDMKVCKFSLAVANEYDPDEGPDQDKTSWFDVELWGSLGEYASKAGRKGMRVGVTGSLNMNSWQGKDGLQREQPVVTAETFEILQSRTEKNPGFDDSANYRNPRNQSWSQQGSRETTRPRLEDLPF